MEGTLNLSWNAFSFVCSPVLVFALVFALVACAVASAATVTMVKAQQGKQSRRGMIVSPSFP